MTKSCINNGKANESSFTKVGFFGTGNEGKFDNIDYLVLKGRLKKFINNGFEKISAVEFDNVIDLFRFRIRPRQVSSNYVRKAL